MAILNLGTARGGTDCLNGMAATHSFRSAATGQSSSEGRVVEEKRRLHLADSHVNIVEGSSDF